MPRRTAQHSRGHWRDSNDPEEHAQRINSLLNPDPSLFGTPESDRFSTTDDDSDIVSVSRQGSCYNLSHLTKQQKRDLMEALKKEVPDDPDEDTLVNQQEKHEEDEEDEETDQDECEQQSEDNSDKEEGVKKEAVLEETQDRPTGMSKAERTEINREMPFVTEVSDANIGETLLIIRNPKFAIEVKLKYLEDYLTTKGLKACKVYLENDRCDFLRYGEPSQKKLAQQAINQKNYDDLESIVESYEKNAEAAKVALGFWMEKMKASQPAENLPGKDQEQVPGNKKKPGKEEQKIEEDISEPKKKMDSKTRRKKAKEKVMNLAGKIPGISPKSKIAEAPFLTDIMELFEKCPKMMNIVLMGATGVGKSSFINSLVNLLSFSDLDDAEKSKFHVLIPILFSHVIRDNSGKMKPIEVSMKANVKVEKLGDADDHNEVNLPGASATQAPKSYLFSWGPTHNRKFIRIIDTPGVADVRGVKQDNENAAKILDFIAGFKEIHAICILLKANEARNGIFFRYCHNQLFSYLHQSAIKNVFFCFTQTRGVDFSPGDSLRTLNEELSNLKIDVDGKYFCFDSDHIRYLCGRKKKIKYDADAYNGYRKSFEESRKETLRLIEAIADVAPHSVGETLDVNNVRRLIMTLLRPIAELTKNTLIITKMMEEQIGQVKEADRKGVDIQQNMNIKLPKLYKKVRDYPSTVCASPKCTGQKGDQVDYKTVCHERCIVHGIETAILNNPDLQKCGVLSGHIDECSHCSCPWSVHMHITYTLETILEDAIDPLKEEELKSITDRKKLAENLVAYYNERIDELGAEKGSILVFLADALAYLKKYSIVDVNDAFIAYLNHLIEQEEAKAQKGGENTLLKELNDYRDQYNELIDQYAKHPADHKVKSTQEMYDLIEELQTMSRNGELFKELQDLEILKLKHLPADDAKTIDLNVGFLGRIFQEAKTTFKKLRR